MTKERGISLHAGFLVVNWGVLFGMLFGLVLLIVFSVGLTYLYEKNKDWLIGHIVSLMFPLFVLALIILLAIFFAVLPSF